MAKTTQATPGNGRQIVAERVCVFDVVLLAATACSADFQSAVSQVFNLRNLAHAKAHVSSRPPCRLRKLSRAPIVSGLEIGDTADWKSALRSASVQALP